MADTTTSPAAPVPARLGVLGLGAMGLPMAEHLLNHHGALTVHSRSPRASLTDAGAVWAATPRELADASDAVLVMLPDLPQLREQIDGPDGLLAGSGDLLLMIGSTSSPVEVRELGAELAERTDGRVRVLDCPVSGGEDGAKAGALTIMAGGTVDDVATATELLAPCGRVTRLGDLGAGEVAKACNQMIVAATVTALGEVSVLADRAGLDLDTLFDVLSIGYAGSRLMESRREKFARGDDSPSGVAKYMCKDLRFASDLAEATATDAALLRMLRATFDDIDAVGLGDRDISVTRRYTEQRSGEAPRA